MMSVARAEYPGRNFDSKEETSMDYTFASDNAREGLLEKTRGSSSRSSSRLLLAGIDKIKQKASIRPKKTMISPDAYDRLHWELVAANQTILAKDSEITLLQFQVSSKESDFTFLTSKISTLEQTIQKQEKEIQSLRSRKARKEKSSSDEDGAYSKRSGQRQLLPTTSVTSNEDVEKSKSDYRASLTKEGIPSRGLSKRGSSKRIMRPSSLSPGALRHKKSPRSTRKSIQSGELMTIPYLEKDDSSKKLKRKEESYNRLSSKEQVVPPQSPGTLKLKQKSPRTSRKTLHNDELVRPGISEMAPPPLKQKRKSSKTSRKTMHNDEFIRRGIFDTAPPPPPTSPGTLKQRKKSPHASRETANNNELETNVSASSKKHKISLESSNNDKAAKERKSPGALSGKSLALDPDGYTGLTVPLDERELIAKKIRKEQSSTRLSRKDDSSRRRIRSVVDNSAADSETKKSSPRVSTRKTLAVVEKDGMTQLVLPDEKEAISSKMLKSPGKLRGSFLRAEDELLVGDVKTSRKYRIRSLSPGFLKGSSIRKSRSRSSSPGVYKDSRKSRKLPSSSLFKKRKSASSNKSTAKAPSFELLLSDRNSEVSDLLTDDEAKSVLEFRLATNSDKAPSIGSLGAHSSEGIAQEAVTTRGGKRTKSNRQVDSFSKSKSVPQIGHSKKAGEAKGLCRPVEDQFSKSKSVPQLVTSLEKAKADVKNPSLAEDLSKSQATPETEMELARSVEAILSGPTFVVPEPENRYKADEAKVTESASTDHYVVEAENHQDLNDQDKSLELMMVLSPSESKKDTEKEGSLWWRQSEATSSSPMIVKEKTSNSQKKKANTTRSPFKRRLSRQQNLSQAFLRQEFQNRTRKLILINTFFKTIGLASLVAARRVDRRSFNESCSESFSKVAAEWTDEEEDNNGEQQLRDDLRESLVVPRQLSRLPRQSCILRQSVERPKKTLSWVEGDSLHTIKLTSYYPESSKSECFYTHEEIKLFGFEKFMEEHSDEFEIVAESDDEWYEEEVVLEDEYFVEEELLQGSARVEKESEATRRLSC